MNDNLDVYVRDMDVPASDPGAFDLDLRPRRRVIGLRTTGQPPNRSLAANPERGASRGVAISADGDLVVFRTDAPSDLPASAVVDTPAGQLFVRDRFARTTTLVTARRDPETGQMTAEPAGGALGGAISADGTTVAWTGVNAGDQTRFLGGENEDPSFPYYLWRRVAAGPVAPTRRITGLSDPDDPACPPEATTVFDQVSSGPCYGPLTDQEANRSGIGDQPPALSADGYTVAFLTGSGPRPLAFTGVGLDLYLTDMTPGPDPQGRDHRANPRSGQLRSLDQLAAERRLHHARWTLPCGHVPCAPSSPYRRCRWSDRRATCRMPASSTWSTCRNERSNA